LENSPFPIHTAWSQDQAVFLWVLPQRVQDGEHFEGDMPMATAFGTSGSKALKPRASALPSAPARIVHATSI
jgi:hypothetical protein